MLHTNRGSKRARVKPAIQIQRTDNTFVDRPTIVNCPVIHPSGGGFVVHMPLKPGDPVVMLFSQRGLSKFKQTFQNTQPDEALLDEKDAMILPGFGALAITAATENGVSMQTEDGSNHVYVENNHVQITSTATVQVDAATDIIVNAGGNITATAGGDMTLNSGSVITMNTGDVIMNADLCVNGSVQWSGDASGKNGGAACMNNGLKILGGTVTHNGTDIGDTHTHPGDSGGTTGTPN